MPVGRARSVRLRYNTPEATRRPRQPFDQATQQGVAERVPHHHDTDNRGHEDLSGSHNLSIAQPWNPGLSGIPPGGTVPPPPPMPPTSPTLCRPLLLGAYPLPSDVPLCSKVLLCDLSLLLPESDCRGLACGLWGDPGGLRPRKGESLGRGLACLSFCHCASSTLRSPSYASTAKSRERDVTTPTLRVLSLKP